MKLRKPTFALLTAAAFLLTGLFPAAGLAQPSEGESSRFTASVNLPEALEGAAQAEVLAGTSMQLIACYDGKYEAPAGTQFCWQYSTTGEPGSFNYLTPSLTDNSHISSNAIEFSASAGATWYRVVLDNEDHEQDTGFVPDVSTAVSVTGADFLFTEPVKPPETVNALPGSTVTLGPVRAENTRNAAVTYQWLREEDGEWAALDGETDASLELKDLEAGRYAYRCRASADLTGDGPRTIISPVYAVEVAPLSIAGYHVRINGEEAELPDDLALEVDAGSTAALTVELTDGSAPASYAWQYAAPAGGWYDLSDRDGVWGYASDTLNVPVSGLTDGNRYRCVVTAGSTVLGSGPDDPVITLSTIVPGAAVAAVTPSPFISCEGQGGTTQISAPAGMPVTFAVANRSTVPIPEEFLSFQWESAQSAGGTFSAVDGADQQTCTIRCARDTSVFLRCRVTNLASESGLAAVSNTLELKASEPDGSVYFTEPLTEPAPQDLRPGDSCTFAAQAQTDDGSSVRFRWQYARVGSASAEISSVPETAWTNISGAAMAVYTADDLEAGSYFYRCIAENSENPDQQAVSLAWKVNVVPFSTKPVVEPSEMTTGLGGLTTPRYIPVGATVGGTVSFAVEASIPSGDRIDYTWYMLPSGPNQSAELMEDAHDATLVLEDIPAAYDACSFFCIASNRSHRSEQTRSGAWHLSVWQASKQPEVLTQPHGIVADYDPAEPGQEISISLTARHSTAAVLEKLGGDGAWTESDAVLLTKDAPEDGTTENEDASQTYSGTIPLSAASFALNGTYRVRVDNGTAHFPGIPPCTVSDTFAIFIAVGGQPIIRVEPEAQSSPVGTQATFRAEAEVEPEGTPLVYCWQISSDGGGTYRNCLSTDGTAQGGTFETAVLTEQMRGRDPELCYRCLAANAATGQFALSSAAALTVTEGTAPPVPDDLQITAAPGSGLKIADGQILGLVVSGGGTEAAVFLAELVAPAGYHLQLQDRNGSIVAEDAPVATGMLVALVSDPDPDEIPVTLTVVVQGDVAGTGRLSIAQLTTMARAVNGQSPLDGAYLKAGDFNANGTIDVSDLVSEAKLLNKAD